MHGLNKKGKYGEQVDGVQQRRK